MPATALSSPRKRIVFLASEKGGVGKSTVALNIVAWSLARGLRTVAIDPDDANHTLVRVLLRTEGEAWHGRGESRPIPVRPDGAQIVVPVNVDASDSLDVVYHSLVAPENDLVVVDGVGSQHRKTVMQWIRDVNFFEVAASVGADITFVLVIEEDADVYAQALRLMLDVGNRVSWVVVQNEKQHQQWPLWEACRARVEAQRLHADVIKLPLIVPHIARALQDMNLCMGVAEHAMPDMLNQQRAKIGWQRVCDELDRAAPSLLPSVGEAPAATVATAATGPIDAESEPSRRGGAKGK